MKILYKTSLFIRDCGVFIKTCKSFSKVNPAEKITHFILSSNEFKKSSLEIKYNSFMPFKGEVSVNRISSVDEKLIWDIGKYVGIEKKRNLHGRGDIKVSEIIKAGVVISPAPNFPLVSHANIHGYPHDNLAMKNAEQKKIAERLALKAGKMKAFLDSPYP